MRLSRSVVEYVLIESLSRKSRQIYDELYFLQQAETIPRPMGVMPKNITAKLSAIVEWNWTVGVLANAQFLPRHKELVINAQTTVRHFYDALTLEGDYILNLDPIDLSGLQEQDRIVRRAWDWCAHAYLKLSVACETEIVLMGSRTAETVECIGMSIDQFNQMSSTEVEEFIEKWKPGSKHKPSSVAARNAEWARLAMTGKSAKEIATEWRQQTGQEVTAEAVRQGISRSRDKR